MKKVMGVAVVLGVLIMVLGSGVAGRQILAPHRSVIESLPGESEVSEVVVSSASGARLHGWWLEVPDPQGMILLLHGIRSDRRSMMGRARFLSRAGYHTLAIDLQAHGESEGRIITLGKREALDVEASLRFLEHRHPDLPIGVIGTSLGGAAAILSDGEVQVSATIVEGVFSTLGQATRNRLRIQLGAAGEWLAPLLIMQVRPRLGFAPEEVSSLKHVARVNSPLFILNGSDDQRTTVMEARQLFAQAPHPKQLWIVPGAGHQDLHRYASGEYERRVLSFLDAHMAPRKVTSSP